MIMAVFDQNSASDPRVNPAVEEKRELALPRLLYMPSAADSAELGLVECCNPVSGAEKPSRRQEWVTYSEADWSTVTDIRRDWSSFKVVLAFLGTMIKMFYAT